MTLCTTFEDYTFCTRPGSDARYVRLGIPLSKAANLCKDSERVFGAAWWARPCCAPVLERCNLVVSFYGGVCAPVD